MITALTSADIHFVNQESLLQDVERCLRRGESCALVGGVGMGKSKLLLRIREVLRHEDEGAVGTRVHLIPVYFRADGNKAESVWGIYHRLAKATVNQVAEWVSENAPTQLPFLKDELPIDLLENESDTRNQNLDAFSYFLQYTVLALKHCISNFRLVLLLDDMYRIEAGTAEVLARHWLSIVDPDRSRFTNHVAVVVTCCKPFLKQFIPSWAAESPKNIANIYLEVIGSEHIKKGIRDLFHDECGVMLAECVIDEICSATGGYPLLYGYVLADLWHDVSSGVVLDPDAIWKHENAWRERHQETIDWINARVHEHRVMPLLVELLVDGRIWTQEELQRQLPTWVLSYQTGDALSQLKSLGLVGSIGGRRYQISGALLRQWLQSNTSMGRIATERGKQMYDVFISYRHVDPDQSWVRHKLLPELQKSKIRVCVDYESFDRSMSVVDNMLDAVKNSSYTMFVVSKVWEQSEFTDFERVFTQHWGLREGKRRLLVVQCEHCTVPDSLGIYPPFVMTDDGEFAEELPRLLKHLRRKPRIRAKPAL